MNLNSGNLVFVIAARILLIVCAPFSYLVFFAVNIQRKFHRCQMEDPVAKSDVMKCSELIAVCVFVLIQIGPRLENNTT